MIPGCFDRYKYCILILIQLLFSASGIHLYAGTRNTPFLTSKVTRINPFIGEEILLTYTLHFKESAPKISGETNPAFEGLWAKESQPERFITSIPETIDGERFRSAVIKQFRLVPLQSGKITISGYTMQCLLPAESVTTNGKKTTDRPIHLAAPAIILSARPFPEPVPDGFSGAVGKFSFNLTADKQQLRAGEPLSLKLTLTGTGNLNTLQLPDLHIPESFRQNTPQKTTTLDKEAEVTSGTIHAAITAWPQSTGSFQIPALRFSFLDPETEQFTTLTTQPLSVRVDPAAPETVSNKGYEEQQQTTIPADAISKAIIFVLLISSALFLVKKKWTKENRGKKHQSNTKLPADKAPSPAEMKQQLLNLLEQAGISSPGALTRNELKTALQKLEMTETQRENVPVILDRLDSILYSPTGTTDTQTLSEIDVKVKALLETLKQLNRSR